MTFWNILLAILLGYLFGSIPTGILAARAAGRPDPRTVGSGHTGGSNMWRTAGRWPAIVTAAGDLLKGVAAVWLVLQIAPQPWLAPLAGTAAVAGHCWPIFASFRGGMGIAVAAGLAAWFFPLLIPIYAAFFYLANRFLRHPARAAMLIAALIPLTLLTLRVDSPRLAMGIGMSLVLIIRFAGDFNRVYDS